MISVVIPTYNHASALAGCLDSLRRQTFSDWEAIVVDDGSTDSTPEVIEKYLSVNKQPQTIAFKRIEHAGAPSARNAGARLTSGEYIIFMDADVIMRPTMLARLLKALEDYPKAAYAYPQFRFGNKLFPSREFDATALRRENFVTMMSLIRREYFPGFDDQLKRFQDWDLWLTMLERGHEGTFVAEELFEARITRRGMSSWRPRIWYAFCAVLKGLNFWIPESYKKYISAKQVIIDKHHL